MHEDVVVRKPKLGKPRLEMLRQQDRVGLGNADGVGHASHEGVKHSGTVAVGNPLGIASGARGVTDDGCLVFLESAELEAVTFGGEQGFVVEAFIAWGRAVSQDDHMFDGGDLGEKLLKERQEGLVDKDQAVFSVASDVAELVGVESQVEGVEHGPHAGDCKVGFEVGGHGHHEPRWGVGCQACRELSPHRGCGSVQKCCGSVQKCCGVGPKVLRVGPKVLRVGPKVLRTKREAQAATLRPDAAGHD